MSRSMDRARAVLGLALAVSAAGITAARPAPLGAVDRDPPAREAVDPAPYLWRAAAVGSGA